MNTAPRHVQKAVLKATPVATAAALLLIGGGVVLLLSFFDVLTK